MFDFSLLIFPTPNPRCFRYWLHCIITPYYCSCSWSDWFAAFLLPFFHCFWGFLKSCSWFNFSSLFRTPQYAMLLLSMYVMDVISVCNPKYSVNMLWYIILYILSYIISPHGRLPRPWLPLLVLATNHKVTSLVRQNKHLWFGQIEWHCPLFSLCVVVAYSNDYD